MEDGTAIFGRFNEDQEKIERASQISVEDTNTLKNLTSQIKEVSAYPRLLLFFHY